MILLPGGSSRVLTDIMTPGGRIKGDTKGRWLVSGQRLLVESPGTNGEKPFVAEYEFKLNGDKLSLNRPGRRLVLTYTRQKK